MGNVLDKCGSVSKYPRLSIGFKLYQTLSNFLKFLDLSQISQTFSNFCLTGITSRGKLCLASRNRPRITVESLGAGRQVEAL